MLARVPLIGLPLPAAMPRATATRHSSMSTLITELTRTQAVKLLDKTKKFTHISHPSMPPPSAPRRRRIIIDDDDSDADERGGPVPQAIPTPPEAAPAEAPAVDIFTVSSDSGSYDSDDPISRKARRISCGMTAQRAAESNAEAAAAQRGSEANAAALTPFQYAAKFGRFPKHDPAVPQPRQQPEEAPHDGCLWNARPPARSQYLDEEAAHVGSSSSGRSGSSEGSLGDDDFIDKTSPDFTAAEEQQLQLLFPLTSKRFLLCSSAGCCSQKSADAAQQVFSKTLHRRIPHYRHQLSTPPQNYPLDRVAVVAGSIANTICSNCKVRKVGNEVKKCGFVDWCFVCDESLWSTNPEVICMRTTASQAASEFPQTPMDAQPSPHHPAVLPSNAFDPRSPDSP